MRKQAKTFFGAQKDVKFVRNRYSHASNWISFWWNWRTLPWRFCDLQYQHCHRPTIEIKKVGGRFLAFLNRWDNSILEPILAESESGLYIEGEGSTRRCWKTNKENKNYIQRKKFILGLQFKFYLVELYLTHQEL